MTKTIEAARYSSIETLCNGMFVEIRALKPNDRAGLEQALKRESTQSIYRRFFSIKRDFSEKEADFFLNIDFNKHVALVAVVTEGDKPAIVGGGRYVTVRPKEAEVAFSIIDEYQSQGLGTLLMHNLAAIAIDLGFETFVAEVLPENLPMLKVFEKCGHQVTSKRSHGVVHVTIKLNE